MRKRIKTAVESVRKRTPKGREEPTEKIAERVTAEPAVSELDHMRAELANAVRDRERAKADVDDARAMLGKRDKELEALLGARDAARIERDNAVAELHDAKGELREIAKRLATLEKSASATKTGAEPELPAVPGSAFEEQARKTPHVSAARGQVIVTEPDSPDWGQHDEEGCARRNGRCAWRELLGETA
jgi:predicted  nucleic acid-binding Zn-ribbon protein